MGRAVAGDESMGALCRGGPDDGALVLELDSRRRRYQGGALGCVPFPLAMTAVLNAIVCLVAFAALRFRGKGATFDKRMVVLGVLQGAEYCFGNMALALLSLSYRLGQSIS